MLPTDRSIPRSEQEALAVVLRRGRHLQTRRRLTVGGGVLGVVLAVAVAAGALAEGQRPPDRNLLAGQPVDGVASSDPEAATGPAIDTDAIEVPLPTTSSPDPISPPRPSTTATTAVGATPDPTITRPRVTTSTTTGRPAGTAATFDPIGTLDPAQEATVRVRVTGIRGMVRLASFDFGDVRFLPLTSAECDPAAPPPPKEVVYEARHRWRRPGTYEVRLEVHDGKECATPAVALERRFFALVVVVRDGPVSQNGPSLPTATMASPGALAVQPPFATDSDGLLQRIEVDYGDGTPPAVEDPIERDPNAFDECQPEQASWPRENTYGPPHTYAAPGTYRLRITVTSAGCDGSERQTTVTEATYTAA